MNYEKIIAEIGLPEKEAAVYAALLGLGEAGAKELLPKLAGVKRANLYALLASLQEKGLAAASDRPGKMRFRAETPEKLRDLVSGRLNRAKEAEGAFERSIPLLVSQFNLASGKPTIQFLEGLDAFRRIAHDSLSSETDILSYIDNEALNRVLAKENQAYVAKRGKLGIKKRMISLDSAYVRERATHFNPAITDMRIISRDLFPFATVMQIYDNKVSYLTLEQQQMIGVIIHDVSIYKMHVSLFEHAWTHAEKIPVGTAFVPSQS